MLSAASENWASSGLPNGQESLPLAPVAEISCRSMLKMPTIRIKHFTLKLALIPPAKLSQEKWEAVEVLNRTC